MNRDRIRHFKRAITDAQKRGVSDAQIGECVNALRSGTNPGELSDVLTEYAPGSELLRRAGKGNAGPDSPALQHAA